MKRVRIIVGDSSSLSSVLSLYYEKPFVFHKKLLRTPILVVKHISKMYFHVQRNDSSVAASDNEAGNQSTATYFVLFKFSNLRSLCEIHSLYTQIHMFRKGPEVDLLVTELYQVRNCICTAEFVYA